MAIMQATFLPTWAVLHLTYANSTGTRITQLSVAPHRVCFIEKDESSLTETYASRVIDPGSISSISDPAPHYSWFFHQIYTDQGACFSDPIGIQNSTELNASKGKHVTIQEEQLWKEIGLRPTSLCFGSRGPTFCINEHTCTHQSLHNDFLLSFFQLVTFMISVGAHDQSVGRGRDGRAGPRRPVDSGACQLVNPNTLHSDVVGCTGL